MNTFSQSAVSELNYATALNAALVLRALNNKLRQQIISLLASHGQLPVSDIYVRLRLDQSIASQQLRVLREARVIFAEQQGRHVSYSLNMRYVGRISRLVESLATQPED